MDNWYEWQTYVNNKIGEFQDYMERKERDNEMYVLRLQRSLDAALQTIGELQSQLQSPSKSDTQGTVKTPVGRTQSF